MTSHPTQPVVVDPHGVHRFKANSIIQHLCDTGALDLNALAVMDFPDEDRRQVAQLLGYSVSGYGDLSYAADEGANAVPDGLSADQPDTAEVTHFRVTDYRCSCGAQWGRYPFDRRGGKTWLDWWNAHIWSVLHRCHCGAPVDGTPDLGPAPMVLCTDCLPARCDADPTNCPKRGGPIYDGDSNADPIYDTPARLSPERDAEHKRLVALTDGLEAGAAITTTGLRDATMIPVGATLTATRWAVPTDYGTGAHFATEAEAIRHGLNERRAAIERDMDARGISTSLISERLVVDLRWTMTFPPGKGGMDLVARRTTYQSFAEAEEHLARIAKYSRA